METLKCGDRVKATQLLPNIADTFTKTLRAMMLDTDLSGNLFYHDVFPMENDKKTWPQSFVRYAERL